MSAIDTIIRQQTTFADEASLKMYRAAAHEKPMLRFTTAGSVDDGKSTLIGRLLHDSNSVLEDHMESLRKSHVNRSTGPVDLSLLTDGLKAEREQGITIDVAYRHFATPRRRFLIADTPGHEQYTRNMATGASTADAAIILVDARHGLTAQSRRHAYIAWLLGIRHLLFAVNKMDLVGFQRVVFENIRTQIDDLSDRSFRLSGTSFHVVPVSALEGDNVVSRSMRMPWYQGQSLLRLLETIDAPAWNTDAPLRFGVQYVIRPNLDFRGYAGRVDSGRIRAGERVTIMPSGKQSRVKRIVTFEGDLEEAFAPMAVTLVLEDELDISRGDWICGVEQPPRMTSQLYATIVWMHEQPLQPGASVLLQQGAMRVPARIKKIVHRINPETYEAEPASQLALNEIAVVEVQATHPLVVDKYRDNRQTGSFILIDRIDNFTLAAGMVDRVQTPQTSLPRQVQHSLRRTLEHALFASGADEIVINESINAVLHELERRGLLLSSVDMHDEEGN
jgi:sulfate adenylyltransferase large subunit